MKELKVTKTILILTLLIAAYRFFYQPNLRQVNWERGEKKSLFAEIQSSKSKKAGELNLIVSTSKGKLSLNVAQIHNLAKCVAGNKIKAEIKVYPLMPGFGSSRELYDYLLFYQGFVARAWIVKDFVCIGDESPVALRLRVFADLQHRYGDSDVLSILAAMNLGTGEVLSEGVKELFNDLGLSHALVVSGFHIGLVYSFFYFFFDFLFSRSTVLLAILPSELFAIPVALLGATFFCFFSGFAAPCIRALVFLYVTVLYRLYGFSAGSLHRLFVTVILILVFDSTSLFDLSFLLSVAAVIGVICGLQFSNLQTGVVRKMISVIAVNTMAWFFTLPICLIFFAQIAPYSTLSNVALLPILTFFFSIIGFPALVIGLTPLGHLFNAYLDFVNVIYSLIWQIHENFPLRALVLEFKTAIKLALIASVFNVMIFTFLYRQQGKKNDDLLQLAPA